MIDTDTIAEVKVLLHVALKFLFSFLVACCTVNLFDFSVDVISHVVKHFVTLFKKVLYK